MLRTINAKFYGIAILLILSFGAGYLVLGFFLHQQDRAVSLARNTILLERELGSINNQFHLARLHEQSILSPNNSNVNRKFTTTISRLKNHIKKLRQMELSTTITTLLQEIEKDIESYAQHFNQLVRLRDTRNMLESRMLTRYKSISSIVLDMDDPELLRPLFNVAHFLISYRGTRDNVRFQAFSLILHSFSLKAKRLNPADSRLHDHLQTLQNQLTTDFRLENQFRKTSEKMNSLNRELFEHFSVISNLSDREIADRLQEAEQVRAKLKLLFLASAVTGLLFLFLILRLFSKAIFEPIKQILQVMHRISHGEMAARFLPGTRRQDEIIHFGLSFNRMLDILARNNQQLLDSRTELEEKIRELKQQREEKEQLADQLKRVEKMEALGTLAGGVAHDLNNILSGIVSYPDLLLLELPEDSPLRSRIEPIRKSGNKAAAIVDDLLTLARRGVQVAETCNLNQIIGEYLESPEFRKLTSINPQIQVQSDLTPQLVNISGSPVHLTKTIMNLVTNGIEAISGSGIIRITTANRYISEPIAGYDVVDEGEYAVLEVADTGSGIPAEDLDKIFEPFYTRKTMGRSGTGLGLAVVWGTVKDHAGYIDVTSSPGRGTCFTLYFPASKSREPLREDGQAQGEIRGSGERILVVDDSASQREIAGDILQQLGYQPVSARSGEYAIEIFAQQEFDLVLLDMIMPPGMDGLDTYRKMLGLKPQQRAIIVSGYTETDRVKAACSLGPARYLKKPYSLKDLGSLVNQMLQD